MADDLPAAQQARNANVLQAQQGQQPQNKARTFRDYLRPVVNENYSGFGDRPSMLTTLS